MNTLDYTAGLRSVVKLANEDPAPAKKPAPGLTKERARAFLTRDLPLTVVPMTAGLMAGEGVVRALNKGTLTGGQPISKAVRYGVPIGAATLSMLGMLAGHAHSRLLAQRAAEIPEQ